MRLFPYAAVDFIIDRRAQIWLLEVNDLPDGPYMIEKVRTALTRLKLDSRYRFLSMNPLTALVELFVRCYRQTDADTALERLAIVYHNKYKDCTPRTELIKVAELAHQRGIDARLYLPEELAVDAEKTVVDQVTGFVPQLIFRRTSRFPPFDVRQPVMNDPRVRYTASNKFATFLAVNDYAAQAGYLIPQPDSYFAPTIHEALTLIQRLEGLESTTIFVIKPVWLWGGQGVLFMHSSRDAQDQIDAELSTKGIHCFKSLAPFIVQPMIRSHGFRRRDEQHYAFEVRAMAYGGEIVSLIARRAAKPIGALNREDSICNLASGGSWVPVLIGGSSSVSQAHLWDDSPEIPFEEPVDSTAICLNQAIYERLRDLTKRIVMAIEIAAAQVTRDQLSHLPF